MATNMKQITIRPETHRDYKDIVMLAPVSVHAAHLRQGIGSLKDKDWYVVYDMYYNA